MTVLFRLSGQDGLEADCGHHKKIRVVFGMFDKEETKIAWYVFSSKADAETQKECTKDDPIVFSSPFGFRDDVGRFIPHTFEKNIALDGLADKKGTPATLDMDFTAAARLIGCSISNLKTKAGEVVNLSFGLQQDFKPSRTKNIGGKVLFLEMAKFDAKKFKLGPQGSDSISKIFAGVI